MSGTETKKAPAKKKIRTSMLVCRSTTKRYIKDRFASTMPHLGIVRVSEHAVRDIDARVRTLINNAVQNYPSRGRTFQGIL